MKKTALLFLALAAGCGSSKVKVTVNLKVASDPKLDPFKATNRLAQLRVRIDGPDRNDDAIADLMLSDRTAVFDGYPGNRPVRIEVDGFDDVSNLVAHGEADLEVADKDLTAEIAFRRNLAYVTHREVCNGACGDTQACVNHLDGFTCRPLLNDCNPACGQGQACVEYHGSSQCRHEYDRLSLGPSFIYIVDLTTRTLIESVKIPGQAPRGIGISARGGDGVVVTYDDGGMPFIGFLSADDNSWKTFPVAVPGAVTPIAAPEIALLAPGQDLGVGAGGGYVTFFNFAQGKVTAAVPLGGRLLQGALGLGGKKAVFITSKDPGVVVVDLTVDPSRAVTVPGGLSGAPAGTAISADGRIAFLTVSDGNSVFALDLEKAALTQLDDGFILPGGAAAYSELMNGIFALQGGGKGDRVVGYNVKSKQHLDLETAVSTFSVPSGIASGPGGRRIIVVSAGTSSAGAGLTTIDTSALVAEDPIGSSVSYPLDPNDSFKTGSVDVHQRYQPNRVAVLYGH